MPKHMLRVRACQLTEFYNNEALPVRSEEDACTRYGTISSIDRFSRAMEGVPSVQGVTSTASGSKRTAALLNEGNIRWSTVYREARALTKNKWRSPINLEQGLDKLLNLPS